MIKAAVIGARHVHFPHTLKTVGIREGVSVSAIAEENESVRNTLLAQLPAGIAVFENAEALLEAAVDVDLALIGTPNGDKSRLVPLLLERGIHVACPKPFCVNRTDLARIRTALETGRAQLFVLTPLRYHSFALAIQSFIREGRAGVLATGHLELPHFFNPASRDEYFFQPAQYGSMMLDTGFNAVDLFTWINPHRIVAACGYQSNCKFPDHPSFADNLVCTAAFENGFHITIHLDWILPRAVRADCRRIVIRGSRGYIEAREDPTAEGAEQIAAFSDVLAGTAAVESEPPDAGGEFLAAISSGIPRRIQTHEQLLLSMENVLTVHEAIQG